MGLCHLAAKPLFVWEQRTDEKRASPQSNDRFQPSLLVRPSLLQRLQRLRRMQKLLRSLVVVRPPISRSALEPESQDLMDGDANRIRLAAARFQVPSVAVLPRLGVKQHLLDHRGNSKALQEPMQPLLVTEALKSLLAPVVEVAQGGLVVMKVDVKRSFRVEGRVASGGETEEMEGRGGEVDEEGEFGLGSCEVVERSEGKERRFERRRRTTWIGARVEAGEVEVEMLKSRGEGLNEYPIVRDQRPSLESERLRRSCYSPVQLRSRVG